MNEKRAFITGISGQDGSFLAEFLLEKGYKVFGLVRRMSNPSFPLIDHLLDKVTLIDGDMTDSHSIYKALNEAMPHEIYNLAAQSFVGTSWKQPELTANVNGLGVARLLENVRNICPSAKVFQASTSELYGNTTVMPQHECTPFQPRSPYGISKLYAYWMVVNYRESYNMFCCNGITFNHESERRGIEFVTRKITHGVAEIVARKRNKILLGNTQAKRDWGYSKDYVEAFWLMLQQDEPVDYVVATGEQHSVQDFIDEAFKQAGFDKEDVAYHIGIDERYYRPADVNYLLGDPSKIERGLGWKAKTKFSELVKIMVDSDLKLMGVNK